MMLLAFFTVLVAISGLAASNGQHLFTITQSLLTWEQARQTCLAAGGDLASILSAQDQSKIDALTGNSGSYWIGFNDRATEGIFVWSDGSAVSFTKWFGGEPNNAGEEDCTQYAFEYLNLNGYWNDIPCPHRHKSICKISVSDPCKNHFEDTIWQRSTGFKITQGSPSRSDAVMTNGWYRFKSKAGGTIPSSCPAKYSCGTEGPIWAEGQLPTTVGNEVILTAHANILNDCKFESWHIKAKKCNENGETFHIYYLRRPVYAISYCAGTEIPCPPDWNSPTGFTPGCTRSFPTISAKPKLTFGVTKTAGTEDVEFKCSFQSDDTNHGARYNVSWYYFATPPQLLRSDILAGKNARDQKITLKSLSDLGFLLGNSLFCRVVSWYVHSTNRKSSPLDSNYTYAGFKIKQPKAIFDLSEKSKPLEITVTATIPVLCASYGSVKDVVRLEVAQLNARDTVSSECLLKFENGTKEKSFKIAVVKDRVNRGNYQMQLKMKVQDKKLFPSVWRKHAVLPAIKVMVSDVPFGRCTSSGDPHISTFDNWYYHHYQIGDYVLVNSTARRFEVQVRTWQCSSVSCNCGIAAREGDDVVVIDMCRDKIPRVYFPSEKTVEKMPGTRIRRDKNGKRFIIDFPSGANIKFDTYHWYSDWYYGNLEVNVPSDDYKNTVGLCGTFDGIRSNEMTDRGGINRGTGLPYGSVGPNEFTESWK